MSTKPEIEFQEGPAPTELVIKDIVVGDGPEATPGAKVEVHYVGVEFDSGEEFDSSWAAASPSPPAPGPSSQAGRKASRA